MSIGLSQALQRKRDGLALDEPAIRAVVRGIAERSLSDCQLGAFAMAVRLRDMDCAETLALALAMRDSGECLDWQREALPGPVLDKHSTGGVGDLASLVLAPMVAACGGFVPMLSGRGLGHTGGTLDKLESLAGYRAVVDAERLKAVVRTAGLAIVAAGPSLAPADARLYAVRDVTATVDSVPLITASILSKKLAGGAAALVLDVKRGSGACFADPLLSQRLAERLVQVSGMAGLPCVALVTDMSQPLAGVVGNALELRAAIAYLRGDATPEPLHGLVLALGTEMLLEGRLACSAAEARNLLAAARDSGRALSRLARLFECMGAAPGVVDVPDRHLARAPLCRPVPARHAGVVSGVDARQLGEALIALGGGRSAPGDAIDHRAGLDRVAQVGRRVARGEPLAFVHGTDPDRVEHVARRVGDAFLLGEATVAAPELVHARLGTAPRTAP